MALNNQTIVARAWLEGTNDYQQRIPDPTKSTLAQTMNALFNPMNKAYRNQFLNFLVNRIAYTYAKSRVFKNPLAEFKKEQINYGSTIEETAFKWLEAHSYDDSAVSLLKNNRPEGISWFHSQNRRDRYDITINEQELRTAFADGGQGFGLSDLVARIMEIPDNSNNYDEFNIMKNSLAMYETEFGFPKRHIDEPVDEETSQKFLKQIIADAGRMKFPSTTFNNAVTADIPVFANADELILITTPEVEANIDVETYAKLFNVEYAKNPARMIIVDNMPIANAVALLTTRDIWEAHDTVLQTESFYNPQTLATNYYLHAWGIYSISPFVPAILYTTDEVASTSTVTVTNTAMHVTPETNTVALGSTVQLAVSLDGSSTDELVKFNESGLTYSLNLTSVDTNSTLNSRTYVDQNNVLHIQKSGLQKGDKITVNAVSTYVNPTKKEERLKAVTTVTIK